MAKFIKYTHPHISVVGQPQMRIVEEVLISVDDIRSLCHNKDGFFVSTKLIDKVYCGTQVIAEDNLILKVSEEDYELTKKVLSYQDSSWYERFKGMSDSQVFQTLLDDGRRAFNQRYPEDENDMTDEEKERERIKQALNIYNGNKQCAAETLGISERTLTRKMKEYGL